MAVQYQQPRRRFTVDDFHRMADAGIFDDNDRVELVDGEIIEMAAIKVPHAVCVDALTMLFVPLLVGRGIVRVQSPIFIDNINEPQPDLILLRLSDYGSRNTHPGADDIFLVVEVADATVRSDRLQKVPRYARAGIQEAWIVNLPKQIVEVYTEPENGKYKSVRRAGSGHTITLTALPDVTVRVDSFLGGAA